jgi:hypothetical protein
MEAATGGRPFWLLACFPLIAAADNRRFGFGLYDHSDSKKRLLNTASFWNDQRSSAKHDEGIHRLTSLLIIPYLAI